MGLFDRRDEKRKSDAFDSPVETIDPNAPPPDPEPAGRGGAVEGGGGAAAAEYGVDQAIQLMRTLPQDNVELVVQVVKHTLESARIEIGRIIDDASHRQEDIESRVKVLRDEIADLEKEIASRRSEIDKLEADYEETSTVKDRLLLAQKLEPGEAAGDRARGNENRGADASGNAAEGEGSAEEDAALAEPAGRE